MATDNRTRTELLSEIETLRVRIEETEDILHAIQSGEVDALVISRPEGEQVFSLRGVDYPYRVLVETMSEGAVFLTSDGKIVYCNQKMAAMLQVLMEKLIGLPLADFVAHQDQTLFTGWLKNHNFEDNQGEITLITRTGNELSVMTSCRVIDLAGKPGVSMIVTDITERKKMEDVTKSAFQYARSLIEASLDPLLTISTDGKVMDVNQSTIAVTGMSRDQLIGSDFFAYFTEPDLARTGYQLVFSQGTVTDYPLAIRHVSGKVTDVLYNASVYRNPQGEIAGVFAAARDVTDRKLAEQQLISNLHYTRSLIEASLDLMVTLSVEGNIISVNKAAEQMTGVTRAQLVGSDFSRYFVEPEKLLAVHQEALTHGFVVEYPLTIKQESEAVFDVLYNVSPYRNQSGAIEGLLGVARNVTERNKAEEKLRLAASVFAHAWEGILITTTDGTIVNVNEAFTRVTSYGLEEVLGQNPHILSSGRQGNDFYAELWNSLSEKGHWYGEVWNRRKNGEVYAVMENISVVRDAQGKASHYIAMISDITLLKEHQSELEHIAHYDALTTLPNRVLLADRLRQGMLQTKRQEHKLAVVFIDLDGFKTINDNYGHKAGDQLLIKATEHMQQVLREGDTLARVGGDEFVAVLLDQPSMAGCVPLLNRLLAAAARPVQFGKLSLQVSASLGITFYPQEDAIDAEQLLRQADQSMYQAKQGGKNCYHFFNLELDRNLRGRYESLGRIRRALDDGEFVLFYQPKVNMRTGAIVGAEALIRWQHPERKLLLPGEFLPVIEDHPLAEDIGEWVIDTALAQMDAWQAAGLDIPISVNVGARQLQQVNFIENLKEALAAHPGISPGHLQLEVLETSALELAGAAQIIKTCRELGVMFALDDFGTGYSSLTYLKRLPVTEIKIDQSFVHNMLDDPDDLSILEGVLSLANAFRLQTIAEGVEQIEHGTVLLQIGCDLAQGYGIARPMPAHLLPGWSAAWRADQAWTESPTYSHDVLPLIFTGVEHRAWGIDLKSYLKGESEAPPTRNNLPFCRFCRLLETNTLSRFSSQPAFQDIRSSHLQMHTLAKELCELYDSGRNPQAMVKLTAFYDLQDILQEHLKELVQEYRQ
jgi:diguanylate cyclase (GGDEF)-like protein/PAS domain S-box-containing protein